MYLDEFEQDRLGRAASELFRCLLNIQRVRRNDSVLSVKLPFQFFGDDYTIRIEKAT